MPEKPAAEKTEQPTARKLTKARQKGQTPQAMELSSFTSIMMLMMALALLAPNMLNWFSLQMKDGVYCNNMVFENSQVFLSFFNGKILDSILIVLPVMATLCAGAVMAGLAVSGFNFAPEALSLKFNRINPITGFGNLFNGKNFVKLCISIAKLIFISLIVWFYLQSKLDVLASLRWTFSIEMTAVIAKIILGLVMRVCIALLVIAGVDTLYQKWKYTQDLKMTKEEVKQERKDMEGSPEIKSRIRRTQYEIAMKRMLKEVPKANVVLVNPTHVAVALQYEPRTMDAPVLVAKGADHLAEKIREIARAYGVPVIRRPAIARAIYSTVELDGAIPTNLYVAVAEVLAMIHRLQHRRG